jgi:hypothetical protein
MPLQGVAWLYSDAESGAAVVPCSTYNCGVMFVLASTDCFDVKCSAGIWLQEPQCVDLPLQWMDLTCSCKPSSYRAQGRFGMLQCSCDRGALLTAFLCGLWRRCDDVLQEKILEAAVDYGIEVGAAPAPLVMAFTRQAAESHLQALHES